MFSILYENVKGGATGPEGPPVWTQFLCNSRWPGKVLVKQHCDEVGESSYFDGLAVKG